MPPSAPKIYAARHGVWQLSFNTDAFTKGPVPVADDLVMPGVHEPVFQYESL